MSSSAETEQHLTSAVDGLTEEEALQLWYQATKNHHVQSNLPEPTTSQSAVSAEKPMLSDEQASELTAKLSRTAEIELTSQRFRQPALMSNHIAVENATTTFFFGLFAMVPWTVLSEGFGFSDTVWAVVPGVFLFATAAQFAWAATVGMKNKLFGYKLHKTVYDQHDLRLQQLALTYDVADDGTVSAHLRKKTQSQRSQKYSKILQTFELGRDDQELIAQRILMLEAMVQEINEQASNQHHQAMKDNHLTLRATCNVTIAAEAHQKLQAEYDQQRQQLAIAASSNEHLVKQLSR